MRKHVIRAALSAAFLLGGWPVASQAETVDFEKLRHMAPPQVHSWAMKQIKQQQAVRAAQAASAVDMTPPVVTAFDAPAVLDVTRADNPLHVKIEATDDRSGVASAIAYATGPSGQHVGAQLYVTLPAKKLTGALTGYDLTAFEAPGTYTFYALYVRDVAGNLTFLDQAQLANLGQSSFTVKNTRGFDAVAPTLLSGKILTPNVSLSSTVPGTDQPPFAGLSIVAGDSGNTAVAGVTSASVMFCTLDESNCISAWANDAHAPGTPKVTLRLGTQLSGVAPGEYHLYDIWLHDRGNNYQWLRSSKFGGSVDFGTYFPTTTITLVP